MIERNEFLTKKEAVAAARQLARGSDQSRRWTVGSVWSDGEPNYATEIHVLEGSPAQGYVLVSYNFAVVISAGGEPLGIYNFSGV
jgi:hypothetical protein